MSQTEKSIGIIIRKSDWSETSRICTILTRDLGKVRVLAKGGRRLKSNFEVGLDLLTVCSIVLIRSRSGGLDLLTEARVEERFPGLRKNLLALNVAYYVAELLDLGTQDYDPHPDLYDHSLVCLRKLAAGGDPLGLATAYEYQWLTELGMRPVVEYCAACQRRDLLTSAAGFSPMAGGIVCQECAPSARDLRSISQNAVAILQDVSLGECPRVTKEVRLIMAHAISSILGLRPKLLSYITPTSPG